MKDLLDHLGYDDTHATAERFVEVLRDFAPNQPIPALDTFAAPSQDLVVLRNLPFHSLCAHHLLPFFGEADIAYLPGMRVAGLGAIARALRHFARQPQLQERLSAHLADYLHDRLVAPVAVRLTARQMCMEMRGVESAGTVVTVALRGGFDAALFPR